MNGSLLVSDGQKSKSLPDYRDPLQSPARVQVLSADRPELLTRTETMAILGLRAERIRELIESGRLPHVKLGRRIYTSRRAVERFLEDLANSAVAG